MSGKTTHSSVGPVDCDQVEREELLEAYLANWLTDEEKEALEAHYFECSRCFDHLRALDDIRAELQRSAGAARPNRHWFARWAAAAGIAATIALASAVIVWMRSAPPPAARQAITPTAPPPSAAPAPSSLAQSTPAVDPDRELEQLARVDPPPYDPLTLRGAQDPATTRFLRGMDAYRQADYSGAVTELRAAAELDPDAAHTRFFLGISQLLSGDETGAVEQLRATIALGDSPYLEEAHLYLAKAFLRQKNIAAADTQLKQLTALGGSSADDARRMIAQLERLQKR
jgi:tetratricopeptide (TPR) repeat protein